MLQRIVDVVKIFNYLNEQQQQQEKKPNILSIMY